MELFHSSKSRQKPNAVLTHFGSMLASVHRLESIYAIQAPGVYMGDDSLIVLDYDREPIKEQTLDEALEAFAVYVEEKTISKFAIEIKNPLHLTDCWMDDPIGSGGLNIFDENEQLSAAQRIDLKKLFFPFDSVVYPQDVYLRLTSKDVNAIIRNGRENAIFKREFKKREERSLAIGEDFNTAAKYEAVWVDLTLKLRKWSLSNNFDAFAYFNKNEGDGALSYVTLSEQQVSAPVENYSFNKNKYLDTIKPVFRTYMRKIWEESKSASQNNYQLKDTYWAGFDPLQFWEPSSP